MAASAAVKPRCALLSSVLFLARSAGPEAILCTAATCSNSAVLLKDSVLAQLRASAFKLRGEPEAALAAGKRLEQKLGKDDADLVMNSGSPLERMELAKPNTTSPPTTTTTSIASTTTTTQEVCVTRKDERVSAFGYETSLAGTPCIFGVDARDEGYHCVMDEGEFGTFGWCYTAKDRSSWGSCSKSCPFFGPMKVLAGKISSIRARVGKLAENVQRKTNVVPPSASAAVEQLKQAAEELDNSTALLEALASPLLTQFLRNSSYVSSTTTTTTTLSCATVKDATAEEEYTFSSATVNKSCLFGRDPRDEGYHCILEDAQFGAFGWCFTSENGEWGSCSESCPLFGPTKVLSDKIGVISANVQDLIDYVDGLPEPSNATTTTKGPNATNAAETANATAAVEAATSVPTNGASDASTKDVAARKPDSSKTAADTNKDDVSKKSDASMKAKNSADNLPQGEPKQKNK